MIIKITIIIAIFINLILGIFVLTQNIKSFNNKLFAILTFLSATWTLTNYISGVNNSIFWFNSTFAFGSLVIAAGLIWTLQLTDKKTDNKKIFFILFFSILFFVSSFYPGFLIKSYDLIYSEYLAISKPGWGLPIYSIFYLITAFLIIYKLISSYKNCTNPDEKKQLKLITSGAFIALTFSSSTTFIFPYFFGFSIWGIDSIGFLIFLTFIAYSITKHHLFNIKVIMVEVVIFGLWVMMLTRLILAKTWQDIVIESSLLTITVIFGIMLIRSVFHEIHQRIHIEKLAKDIKIAYTKVREVNENLEEKISEQTKQIRRAYEVEKEARTKLEKLNKTKDEFITSTQHHLRTPLTSLKWELESIRKNNEKLANSELENSLSNANESIANMSNIIENFIKITERN